LPAVPRLQFRYWNDVEGVGAGVSLHRRVRASGDTGFGINNMGAQCRKLEIIRADMGGYILPEIPSWPCTSVAVAGIRIKMQVECRWNVCTGVALTVALTPPGGVLPSVNLLTLTSSVKLDHLQVEVMAVPEASTHGYGR
jgi:hypothetical protein